MSHHDPDRLAKAIARETDRLARQRQQENWQGIIPGMFIAAFVVAILTLLGL